MRKLLFALLMAAFVVAQPVVAIGGGLNYDTGDAPNPMIEADTTVEDYNVSWGDTLKYENNSGEVVRMPAVVNSSTDVDDLGNGHVNPYTFTVTDVDFDDAGEFPRNNDEEGNNSASALDASEWTTSGASVSDTTTAPGVDAVQFSASAAGDSATYSNFSVSSDAEKRYFQAFYDITSASGASTVNVTIHDATDGDTAVVELYNSTGMTSADDVGANSTGEGKAMQVQVGDLDATGGDSTIQEIGQVVVAADGSATVKMSALNLEQTGKYKLGTKYVNTDTSDDDDDLETETVFEATGPISVYSLETLGPAFDDASIKGVTFPAQWTAAQLDDDNVNATFAQDNAYPQWDSVFTGHYRLELPSAYDLSFSNAEAKMDQGWASTRYVSIKIAEGTSDDDEMHEVDSSEYSDVTSNFDEEGEFHSLDQTISVGDNYDIKIVLTLTGDEASAMQSSSSSSSSDDGGAGLLGGGSGGGLLDFLWGLPGVVLAAVGALFARSKGVI